MTENAFPVRAWPDICSAYRDGDLAKACLALQEAFAIDVPLLLILSLADRAGYGIASVSVDDLVRGAAAWRETVIVPLRQARQGMKLRFTAPAEAALREGIKRLELGRAPARAATGRCLAAADRRGGCGEPLPECQRPHCGCDGRLHPDFQSRLCGADCELRP
jgi:uncharacterized protein (TIGR02444 family)